MLPSQNCADAHFTAGNRYLTWGDYPRPVASTSFFLQYQGMDDLTLQQQYARFVVEITSADFLHWSRPNAMPTYLPGSKIRLGYVSSCIYARTIGVFLMGWLEKYDRSEFEVFWHHFGNHTDSMTARFRDITDHFFQFSNYPLPTSVG